MPIVVGISGGTGSGKTTLARKILSAVGAAEGVILAQDSYYRDFAGRDMEERRAVNFDHPDSLDTELFLEHLEALMHGHPVDVPVYDFATHSRMPRVIRVHARPVVIVEGILLFADPRVLRLLDLKIFVDCEPDIRFIRRLLRDVEERGRTLESVVRQYLTTVRPMHLEHVEPGRRCADIILGGGGMDEEGVGRIVGEVRTALARRR